ncbi:hypothetical protein KIW84_055159 [Lathyrus oleraceus]|uniref:VAN3-binding protein-like auxin canalisation domain-containing protein n=1 Tax=Pisum sativum TaxID=3888 RepID=A0A9D4WV26_PEA|nr:hypothetical protein KIW84_055159 [Pisum sativum]
MFSHFACCVMIIPGSFNVDDILCTTAEALGTEKEHFLLLLVLLSNVRSHGDINTLTAAAATALRVATTLEARALKEMWSINVVMPLEKSMRFGICSGTCSQELLTQGTGSLNAPMKTCCRNTCKEEKE